MAAPIVVRLASVTLAVVGAVCLAIAASLLFLWTMDQSGFGASATLAAGGLGIGAVGGLCAWLSRRVVVARRTP